MTAFYISLPITAFAGKHDTADTAKTEACAAAQRYQEDFVVLEVSLIGTYQSVSPIWEAAPALRPFIITESREDKR